MTNKCSTETEEFATAVVVDLGCGEAERHISGTIPCDLDYPDCVQVNARERLPWKDGSIDIVTSFAAFRNFWDTNEELESVLREIARVLKVRGMLIVNDYMERFDWNTDEYCMLDAKEEEERWRTAAVNVGLSMDYWVFSGDKNQDNAPMFSVTLRKKR